MKLTPLIFWACLASLSGGVQGQAFAPEEDEEDVAGLSSKVAAQLRQGNRQAASAAGRKLIAAKEAELEILADLPPAGRPRKFAQLSPFQYLIEIGDPALFADASLLFKGRLLDASLLDYRFQRLNAQSPRVVNWLQQRAQLRTQYLAAMESGDARALKEAEEKFAMQWGKYYSRKGVAFSVYEIRSLLREDQAILDITIVPDSSRGEYVYAGVVIRKSGVKGPVVLGTKREVDGRIASFRAAVKAQMSQSTPETLNAVSQGAATLYQTLITPFETVIADATHLLVAPDGMAHLVPFAFLPDREGNFLIEKKAVQSMDSLRALALGIERAPSYSGKSLLLVGNPSYGQSSGSDEASASRLVPSLSDHDGRVRGNVFGPLPGAESEVLAIASVSRGNTALQVTTLINDEASEATVSSRMVQSRVVHLATHGFTLVHPGGQSNVFPGESDPMNLSGLALKGANPTFSLWQRSGVSPSPTDGILTAADIVALDLAKTEQVILSACDTGLGVVQPNDGIVGIRRALTLAGVSKVVITLWPVSDAMTATLMERHYRSIIDSSSNAETWAQTVRDLSGDLRGRAHPGQITTLLGAFVFVENSLPKGATDPQSVLRQAMAALQGDSLKAGFDAGKLNQYFTKDFVHRITIASNGKIGLIEKFLPAEMVVKSVVVEGDEAYVVTGETTFVLIKTPQGWLIDDAL